MYFCRAGSSCQWELLNIGISVILIVGLYTSKSCACQWEVYNTSHDL
ncbi:hypothetical protein SLEP1_g42402 [Rubroshorea leprosula]|uniref:Uncharacterized protein n=1 Tax=Rubroshorea leprosula TaxID=152421 RepID=A0AAV5LAL7_9ROSI|nr:hypothetical protein SLEP1_g42402 [Rubroshorea leprosula]